MSRHEVFPARMAGGWWVLGPEGGTPPPAPAEPLLVRGALLAETRPGAVEAGGALIDWTGDGGMPRSLRLTIGQGQVRLVHAQGPIRREALLDGVVPAPGAALRIAFVWDGPNRRWRLDLEDLASGRAWRARGVDPMPLPAADAAALVAGPAPALAWLALTDTIARAAGTMLTPGSVVPTPTGPRTIGALMPGDTVLADDGALVLDAAETVAMPAIGPFAPVRIGANSLGARHDLALCPRQRLVICDRAAEYLFGEETVTIEARHLAGHPSVRLQPQRGPVDYVALRFARPATIRVNGCRVAASGPDGWRTPGRLLRGFEAQALVGALQRAVGGHAA